MQAPRQVEVALAQQRHQEVAARLGVRIHRRTPAGTPLVRWMR